MAGKPPVLFSIIEKEDSSSLVSFFRELTLNLDVNDLFDEDGFSPLHRIILTKNKELFRIYCIEAQEINVHLRSRNAPHLTALHVAATVDNDFAVPELLKLGGSLSARDAMGRTPYEIALQKDYQTTALTLLLEGLKKSIQNNNKDKIQMVKEVENLYKNMSSTEKMKMISNLINLCVLYGDHRSLMQLLDSFTEAAHCIQEDYAKINHVAAFLSLCHAAFLGDCDKISQLLDKNLDDLKSLSDEKSFAIEQSILLPLLMHQNISLWPAIQIAISAQNERTAYTLLHKGSLLMNKGSSGILSLAKMGLRSDCLFTSSKAPSLAKLVTVINLSQNPLQKIRPFDPNVFQSLTHFNASKCGLESVAVELFCLPAIQDIKLSNNNIAHLPEFLEGQVSKVKSLSLSSNLVTDIPNSFQAPKLQLLDLSENRLKHVPKVILQMVHLQTLKLSGNHALHVIPYEIGLLDNLKNLVMDDLKIHNVPRLVSTCLIRDYIKPEIISKVTFEHFEVVFIGSNSVGDFHKNLVTKLYNLSPPFSIISCPTPSLFLASMETILKPPQIFVCLLDIFKCISEEMASFKPILKCLSLKYPTSYAVFVYCSRSSSQDSIHRSGSSYDDYSGEDDDSTNEFEYMHMANPLLVKEVTSYKQEFVNCNLFTCAVVDPLPEEPCNLTSLFKIIQKCGSKVTSPVMMPKFDLAIQKHIDLLSEPESGDSNTSSKKEQRPILVGNRLHQFIKALENDVCLPEPDWLLSTLEKQRKISYISNKQAIVWDRQWLCNFVQSAIEVVHQNAFIQPGFLPFPSQATIFSGTGIGGYVPDSLSLYLRNVGVAFSINQEVVFVPHTLSNVPGTTPKTRVCSRVISASLLPPTFWNRLLSHVVTCKEDLLQMVNWSTKGSSESEQPLSLQFWTRGVIAYETFDTFLFSFQGESSISEENDTIEIVTPLSSLGLKLLTLLTNLVLGLLKNWYPYLWPTISLWVPCSVCKDQDVPFPHLFPLLDSIGKVCQEQPVVCPTHEKVQQYPLLLVPDLFGAPIQGSFSSSVKVKADCEKSNGLPRPVEKREENDRLALMLLCLDINSLCCSSLACLKQIIVSSPLQLVFDTKEFLPVKSLLNKGLHRISQHAILIQVANGLNALHSRDIIHRDVCVENILVKMSETGHPVEAKLSGFHNASMSLYKRAARGVYGRHPAPEMMQEDGMFEYDSRVDVYAFAFSAYELFTGSVLKDHNASKEPLVKDLASKVPLLVATLNSCWDANPGKRPFLSQLLRLLLQSQVILPKNYKIISEDTNMHHHCTVLAPPLRDAVPSNSSAIIFYGSISNERISHFQCCSIDDLSVKTSRGTSMTEVIKHACIMGHLLFTIHFLKKVPVIDIQNFKLIKQLSFDSEVISMDTDGHSRVVFGLNNGNSEIFYFDDVASGNEFSSVSQSFVELSEYEPVNLVKCYRDSIVFVTPSKLEAFDVHSLKRLRCWEEREIRDLTIPFRPNACKGLGEIWTVSVKAPLLITILHTNKKKDKKILHCKQIFQEECAKGISCIVSLVAVADVVWVGLNRGTILLINVLDHLPLSSLHLHQDYFNRSGLTIFPVPTISVFPSKESPFLEEFSRQACQKFTVVSTGYGLSPAVFTAKFANLIGPDPIRHHGLTVITLSPITSEEHSWINLERRVQFPNDNPHLCYAAHSNTTTIPKQTFSRPPINVSSLSGDVPHVAPRRKRSIINAVPLSPTGQLSPDSTYASKNEGNVTQTRGHLSSNESSASRPESQTFYFADRLNLSPMTTTKGATPDLATVLLQKRSSSLKLDLEVEESCGENYEYVSSMTSDMLLSRRHSHDVLTDFAATKIKQNPQKNESTSGVQNPVQTHMQRLGKRYSTDTQTTTNQVDHLGESKFDSISPPNIKESPYEIMSPTPHSSDRGSYSNPNSAMGEQQPDNISTSSSEDYHEDISQYVKIEPHQVSHQKSKDSPCDSYVNCPLINKEQEEACKERPLMNQTSEVVPPGDFSLLEDKVSSQPATNWRPNSASKIVLDSQLPHEYVNFTPTAVPKPKPRTMSTSFPHKQEHHYINIELPSEVKPSKVPPPVTPKKPGRSVKQTSTPPPIKPRSPKPHHNETQKSSSKPPSTTFPVKVDKPQGDMEDTISLPYNYH